MLNISAKLARAKKFLKNPTFFESKMRECFLESELTFVEKEVNNDNDNLGHTSTVGNLGQAFYILH